MRKLQKEMSELKNLVGQMKKSLEVLTNRISTAENRVSEVQKTSMQQK